MPRQCLELFCWLMLLLRKDPCCMSFIQPSEEGNLLPSRLATGKCKYILRSFFLFTVIRCNARHNVCQTTIHSFLYRETLTPWKDAECYCSEIPQREQKACLNSKTKCGWSVVQADNAHMVKSMHRLQWLHLQFAVWPLRWFQQQLMVACLLLTHQSLSPSNDLFISFAKTHILMMRLEGVCFKTRSCRVCNQHSVELKPLLINFSWAGNDPRCMILWGKMGGSSRDSCVSAFERDRVYGLILLHGNHDISRGAADLKQFFADKPPEGFFPSHSSAGQIYLHPQIFE